MPSSRKTDTSILPNQKSFIVLTCSRMSQATPRPASEMATVRITAIVMLRLRRRPMAISDSTKRIRTGRVLSAGVAVDAAALVAGHVSLFELDDPSAHRVDDVRVVGRHDDSGAGAVDA